MRPSLPLTVTIHELTRYPCSARLGPSRISHVGHQASHERGRPAARSVLSSLAVSSAAHLADSSSHAESETASLKRQLARALAQAEEYRHSSSRTALEASTAADKAAAQLAEYAARVDQLERHRAVLLAKEREAAERAQARESGESDDKTRLEAEVRALRAEVGQLKDDNADLQESFTDLEHAATQAVAKANDRQKRAELLEAEMLRLRNEADQYLEAASSEKKRRVAVEAELERERSRAKESGDAHVIREELHRASVSLSLSLLFVSLS